MTKQTPQQELPSLEPNDLLHQPHDKYIKTVLSVREVALEFIEFSLSEKSFAQLDLDTLKLEKDGFLGKKFKQHFADIIWSAMTKAG